MITFVMTILGWLVSSVMTLLSWLVTAVILRRLAENAPTVAGLVLGAAGLGVGIGCLVVAFQIADRQDREAKKAEDRYKALIEARYEQLKILHEQLRALIEGRVLVLLEAQGQTITPKLRADVSATAETIVNQVIQMPILEGAITLHDLPEGKWVRVRPDLESGGKDSSGGGPGKNVS